MKNKLKVIKVPILNRDYCVYILQGKKEKALKWLVSYYGDTDLSIDDFENYRGRTFYKKGCYPVIYITTKHKYSTLAHEAVHAIDYIWEYIEENNKDEVYAHSVGAVVFAIEGSKK